jgi:hypothetical protein
VTRSCAILPRAPATTIQIVTCRPTSEGSIQHSTDTEKVCTVSTAAGSIWEDIKFIIF